MNTVGTFPRVTGYRYELIGETLEYEFDEKSNLKLNTKDIPTFTENAPIAGQSIVHRLEELKHKRVSEIAFLLAQLILDKYFQFSDKGFSSDVVVS